MTTNIKVNDIVVFLGNRSDRYGIVIEIEMALRSRPLRSTEEPRFRVRYMDAETGKPFVCPDSRCGNRWKTCPICSCYVWRDELHKLTEDEKQVYREAGMLVDACERTATP